MLDEYISDSCPAKAAYLEQAAALQSLEPVEVVVPEGAMLFDIEEGVAVAKRSLQGPSVLVNGEPTQDDPARSVSVKLVLEGNMWRVANCEAYVSE